jgi:hypothetical protein
VNLVDGCFVTGLGLLTIVEYSVLHTVLFVLDVDVNSKQKLARMHFVIMLGKIMFF